MVRYLAGFICVLVLGLMGCGETTGTGGTGGYGAPCDSDADCRVYHDCAREKCEGGRCISRNEEDGTPCGGGAGTCEQGSCTGRFKCEEQGIRNAVASCCGPHTFDCTGQTTVLTAEEITIELPVTLDGGGLITLDANANHRILSVRELPSPYGVVRVKGFNFRRGSAELGGGIHNEASLVLRDCELFDNTAQDGGAIWTVGPLLLENCTLRSNTARNGGAIWGGGGVVLKETRVYGNDAEYGGGIHGGGLIETSEITENEARAGGGIYSVRWWVELHGSTVSGNRGGGVYAGSGVELRESTVSDNRGSVTAGGISGATVRMFDSTLSGNLAECSGAGGAGGCSVTEPGGIGSGSIIMVNSTASGNGDGLRCWGDTILLSSTVLDRTESARILVSKNSVLRECETGLVISDGYNIESPGNTCGFDEATDQVNVTAEELKLGPLQDNGGPTETHALGEGSVAIDVIPETECLDAEGEPLTTDQRGFPRDSMCDVGAFEVQP